jgi:phosphoserine aminotransferase
MGSKIYNYSAGPAILPDPVLERARDEIMSLGGIWMSVIEISHRSRQFETILHAAEQGLRSLLDIPSNYRILFLQGGATLQFSMIPMNFLGADDTADYVLTGAWGKKAIKEAKRCGRVNIPFSSAETGFRSVPPEGGLSFSPNAKYVHYTSNETIEGVEFQYEIDGGGIPVVCDMSSNILSKPIDIEKYGLIYAGAQKNNGPSGVTVVIISDEMLASVPEGQHSLLDYRAIAENDSMLNTPNTWGIYLISLVCEWLQGEGGVAAITVRNREKAAKLYDAIDSSDGYYNGHAETDARSMMNVTFRLSSEDLEKKFCAEATAAGLDGLKGHRSVGGIRASIYNAFPADGVGALTDFMQQFAAANG